MVEHDTKRAADRRDVLVETLRDLVRAEPRIGRALRNAYALDELTR
jgi:hypothetical protein